MITYSTMSYTQSTVDPRLLSLDHTQQPVAEHTRAVSEPAAYMQESGVNYTAISKPLLKEPVGVENTMAPVLVKAQAGCEEVASPQDGYGTIYQ